MRMFEKLGLLMLAVAVPVSAQPLPPSTSIAGERTRMLTLGNVHLSEVPAITAPMLDPLLERLARFRPQVITVESMGGEQCEMLRRSRRHAEAASTYCSDPAPAQALAGVSRAEAEDQAETMLARFAADGAKPTPADRRRAALLLLAAGEPLSAMVQWRRLPETERIAADGLDTAMVKLLNRDGRRMNESYNIGVVLAARLGLERIHAVDDHSSDAALHGVGEAHGAAMSARFERLRASPLFATHMRRQAAVTDGASLLAFLRQINSPATMRAQSEGDFGQAMGDRLAAPFGRYYAGWWETRNLRMVGNIRAAVAQQLGARVLNLVGVAHKPWYDDLLGRSPDVTIVDVSPFLR